MSIKLQLPKLVDIKPRLTVIGVGGAGCNAVNNMIAAGLQGVEFVVANTDAQSLAASSAEHRLQLGANLTEGLGAGSRPEIGEAAAEEALDEIRAYIAGSHMVFIAAGMGGGTGTGAAGVIARAARELGVLTVGIVCKPFQFEGARRMRIADAGVQTLRQLVDTLIVIPNQNLFRIANERTTFAEAFVLADQVLYSGVACIVELVLKEGLINLDFADVRTVMSGMGTAMMGTGEAAGERRAILAAEEAIANPLLDDVTLKGAKGLLLAISGGRDMTLYEVDEAASRVRQEVDPDANIIVGATFDDNLGDRIRVSIVASGMGRMGEPLKPIASTKPATQSSQPAGPGPLTSPMPYPSAPQIFAHGNGRDDDMHRRLSEALQPAHAPQTPFHPHAPLPQATHPAFAQNSGNADLARPVRDTWTAPGNVIIEDGLQNFPTLTGAALSQTPPLPASHAPSNHHMRESSTQFQPAPPVEIQRSARRMPTVDDFSAVAQKAWHAQQPRPDANFAGSSENTGKHGFFGRLTGMSRRPTDARDVPHRPSANSAQGASQEDVEMPIFVGRERR